MLRGRYDIEIRPKITYRGMITTAQIGWELEQLINIYDELQPEHVLEIGSQYGGTLYYWLEGAVEGAKIANIDILQNMKPEEAKRLPGQWASWAPDQVHYQSFIGRSDDPKVYKEVIAYLEGGIDFLWIDALHTYEGAKKDFERYGNHVRKGGVIALHDLVTPDFSPHIQVGKFWREVQAAGYKTRELRAGAEWGGIGVVYV